MGSAKFGFVVAITVLVIVFVLQNMTVVEINFLFWSFAVSRALILFVVLLAGMAIGWLGCLQSQSRRR